MKKGNKKHQNVKYIGEKLKIKGLMLLVLFVHVICKISNFVNRKAFGFLYWINFKISKVLVNKTPS